MTKEEIITRCRKVTIQIEGNRIFCDPETPYQFVTAFRNRQLAENNRSAIAGTASRPFGTRKTVCEFYLVPISFIDRS